MSTYKTKKNKCFFSSKNPWSDFDLENLENGYSNFLEKALRDNAEERYYSAKFSDLNFKSVTLPPRHRFDMNCLINIEFMAMLREASFYSSRIDRSDFSYCIGDKCNFSSSSGEEVKFIGANLADASFYGATLVKAKFEAVLADRTDFGNSYLESASFAYASLKNSNFKGSSCRGVNFQGADLTNSKFNGANLADANFENATLISADFNGANYANANFNGAIVDITFCPKGYVNNNGILSRIDTKTVDIACRAKDYVNNNVKSQVTTDHKENVSQIFVVAKIAEVPETTEEETISFSITEIKNYKMILPSLMEMAKIACKKICRFILTQAKFSKKKIQDYLEVIQDLLNADLAKSLLQWIIGFVVKQLSKVQDVEKISTAKFLSFFSKEKLAKFAQFSIESSQGVFFGNLIASVINWISNSLFLPKEKLRIGEIKKQILSVDEEMEEMQNELVEAKA